MIVCKWLWHQLKASTNIEMLNKINEHKINSLIKRIAHRPVQRANQNSNASRQLYIHARHLFTLYKCTYSKAKILFYTFTCFSHFECRHTGSPPYSRTYPPQNLSFLQAQYLTYRSHLPKRQVTETSLQSDPDAVILWTQKYII